MEEKKFTDEEIIKALDICYSAHCCSNECPYFNKHGRNFCVEDKAFYKDMKRVVQEHAEQKAEIERLKIQVDELLNIKIEPKIIECHGMLKGCDMVNQAVKDTSKEIYLWLKSRYPKLSFEQSFIEKFGIEVKE